MDPISTTCTDTHGHQPTMTSATETENPANPWLSRAMAVVGETSTATQLQDWASSSSAEAEGERFVWWHV